MPRGQYEHLQTSKGKREFLKELGFEQTYDGEPKTSKVGTVTNMEKWEKHTKLNAFHLYIHYEVGESAFCNLYHGENDDDPDVFSERNLISQMKKRDFEDF